MSAAANAVLIAILTSSVWGAAAIIIGGWQVRRRTDAERKKLASESEKLDVEAEDRIYTRLREQLEAALERAGKAENRAEAAIQKANTTGEQIYQLVDLMQDHQPWDRRIYDLLLKLLPEQAAEIGEPPELNPYPILTGRSHPKDTSPGA